jgi:hypothetical protein
VSLYFYAKAEIGLIEVTELHGYLTRETEMVVEGNAPQGG